MKKKYLIGTGIVLVLLAAILLGAGQYMLNYSLRPITGEGIWPAHGSICSTRILI